VVHESVPVIGSTICTWKVKISKSVSKESGRKQIVSKLNEHLLSSLTVAGLLLHCFSCLLPPFATKKTDCNKGNAKTPKEMVIYIYIHIKLKTMICENDL
jgi:uncharacterized protein YuzB (UPF0349 family)